MADALYATHASEQAVRAAVLSAEDHTPPEWLEGTRRDNAFHLAIAYNGLREAASFARGLHQAEVREASGGAAIARVFAHEVALDVELGKLGEARRLSAAFAADSRSWPRSDFFDSDATSVFLDSISGLLDPAHRAARRDQVLAGQDDAYGSPARRWLNGWVITSFTPAEARDAVGKMPEQSLFPPDMREAEDDYFLGEVFVLADKQDTGASFLTRASHACSIGSDFYRTKATLALAKLSADHPEAACPLLEDVARHWAGAPESATVVEAKKYYARLKCSVTRQPTTLGAFQ
jgi:hypothetical protein